MAKRGRAPKRYRWLSVGGKSSGAILAYEDFQELEDIPDGTRRRILEHTENEVAAQGSTDWLKALAVKLQPAKRLKGAGSRQEILRAAQREAEAILASPAIESVDPKILRLCFVLGCKVTAAGLSNLFGGEIASAHRVSVVNAAKGRSTALLDTKQWGLIKSFIERRGKGVSVAEACRQARTLLHQGRFKSLPGVRIDISQSALEKRWRKRTR